MYIYIYISREEDNESETKRARAREIDRETGRHTEDNGTRLLNVSRTVVQQPRKHCLTSHGYLIVSPDGPGPTAISKENPHPCQR